MYILAYTSDAIDDETMRRLNMRSMEEVKHLNGAIRYENAVKIQRGGDG